MRFFVLIATISCSLLVVPGAPASQLIARNGTNVKLAADDKGRAVLTYTAKGHRIKVMASGAVDARQPDTGAIPQVEFKVNYRGKGADGFRSSCDRYDGPPLAWLVTACRAKDGSYWAVQSWQRALPNAGYKPWTALQSAWDLRLSHWTATGGQALFEIYPDWVYSGRFHELFGRVTYQGQAVHGFKSTSRGEALDGYGRNVYLDTLGSAYGQGWHRENAFLAHNPSGMFCYSFIPRANYPRYPVQRREALAGTGRRYRITMIGPGVSPDIMWTGDGLPNFDRANSGLVDWETQMNAKLDGMRTAYGEKLCAHH
jgi:hypothetical protein